MLFIDAFAGNESVINKIFSESEKQQIKEIVQIMDSLVIAETNVKDIDSAYLMFLIKTTNQQYDHSDTSHVSTVGIAGKFKDSLIFDKIWIKEYGFDPKTKENVKEWLAFNVNGKYLLFLKKLSRQHKNITGYYKTVIEMNSIVPTTNVWFFNNFITLDLNDPDIRFMVGVHFITALYVKDL